MSPAYSRNRVREGFHPLGAWLANTPECLAMLLRPGNAGSNTFTDHREVLAAAVARRVKPSRRHLRNLTDYEKKTGWKYSITCTNIPDAGIAASRAATIPSTSTPCTANTPPSRCCPSLKIPMKAALVMPMWGCGKAPPWWCAAGLCGGGAGGCG